MECISKRVNKIKDNAVCRKLMALQTGKILVFIYVRLCVSMHEIISLEFFNALRINATCNITFDHKERSTSSKFYAIVTFTHPILANKRHNKNCSSKICNWINPLLHAFVRAATEWKIGLLPCTNSIGNKSLFNVCCCYLWPALVNG